MRFLTDLFARTLGVGPGVVDEDADGNFRVKVTADGASYLDGIIVDKTTGAVSLPNTDVTSSEQANNIAAGNTAGLRQQLLADAGQVGKTVLAVGYTMYQGSAAPSPNHRAQIVSLGEGNTAFVYATGADYSAGVVQEGPIFLGLGEVYVIENVQPGTIITAAEGAYGASQQVGASESGPMPLLSLALSVTDSFFYAFRESQRPGDVTHLNAEGWVHVVCGPVAASVTLETGDGSVVLGQANIALAPWEYRRFGLDGNREYRIRATDPIMACVNASMGTAPQVRDNRLILPLTNDGITWPRQGYASAPYAGTDVRYFVNDGASGSFSVSPGSPANIETRTGAGERGYYPRGATRFRAAGLITAYSGADGDGYEATPLCALRSFTQRIAIPMMVRAAPAPGSGTASASNSIALASPYAGTARLYEWDDASGEAVRVSVRSPSGALVDEIPLIRRDGAGAEAVATTRPGQEHPTSALISGHSSDASSGAHYLEADFKGGFIEVDVPAMVVLNASQSETDTFRGTAGAATPGVLASGDETLMYGITPETIRAEIREGRDGLLYRRVVGSGGSESWVVA